MPVGTEYTYTELPVEVVASPAASQPDSDIETHYNKLLRGIKELWAALNGASAGTDANGTPLGDYTGLGVLERLTAIEDSGKIQDSDKIQIGTTLSAGDRYLRFTLGSLTTYAELYYNQSDASFKFRNQAGTNLRVKGATPTATDDLTTKAYVDNLLGGGVLAKACWCARPVRSGNLTFTIDWIYSNDSVGTKVIGKATQSTVTLSTIGKNGVLGSSQSKFMPGTVSVTNGSAAITGVGTTFSSDFQAGDYITTNGGAIRKILSVTNNLSMTATGNFSATESGVAYSRGGTYGVSTWELNLYAFSDGSDVCFGLSTRNTLGGDTLVDIPKNLKTGTAACTNGSAVVTGTGTAFLSEITAGQQVMLQSGGTSVWGTVLSVDTNTQLTLTAAVSTTVASGAVYTNYVWYRQLPFSPPVDGSGNQRDYVVEGFPHAAKILLRATVLTIVNNNVATSPTSKDLIANNVAPDLTDAIDVILSASSVSNASAPNSFYFGSASGDTNRWASPWSYTWNGPTTTTGTGTSSYAEVPLDTSNQAWYQSGTTNVTGSAFVTGVRLGKWL